VTRRRVLILPISWRYAAIDMSRVLSASSVDQGAGSSVLAMRSNTSRRTRRIILESLLKRAASTSRSVILSAITSLKCSRPDPMKFSVNLFLDSLPPLLRDLTPIGRRLWGNSRLR
jgi:hypothetical protein